MQCPNGALQAGDLAGTRSSKELDLHRRREGNFILVDERIQSLSYLRIAETQIGNPDRGVDEDQDRLSGRRRDRAVSTATSTLPARDLSS